MVGFDEHVIDGLFFGGGAMRLIQDQYGRLFVAVILLGVAKHFDLLVIGETHRCLLNFIIMNEFENVGLD